MAAGGLITGVGLIIAFTSGGDETALDTTDLDQAPPTSDPAPADVAEDDGLRPVENSLGSDVATSLTTPTPEAAGDTGDSSNADSTSSTRDDETAASSPDRTVTPDPVADAATPSGSTSSTGATTANPSLPIAAKPTETTGIPEGTDQGTNPTGSGPTSTAPSSTTATTAPTTATPTTEAPTTTPTTAAPTTAPPTTPSPTPVEPAEPITGVWDYLGNPWVPSHLANLTVQGNERYTYRFTAKHTGPMTGFINYMQANTSRTGYAGGNGGTIRFRLVPDQNGLPNENTVLAETTWNPNLTNGSAFPPGSTNHTDTHHISFAQKNWPTPPTLTAGTTYHLITENIHPNNTTNYISINNPYAVSNHTRSPHGPQNQHWGITRNTGSGWHDYTTRNNGTARYEPNLLILMANGNHYGNSYMESKNTYPINNTNHIRQTFTPTHTTHHQPTLHLHHRHRHPPRHPHPKRHPHRHLDHQHHRPKPQHHQHRHPHPHPRHHLHPRTQSHQRHPQHPHLPRRQPRQRQPLPPRRQLPRPLPTLHQLRPNLDQHLPHLRRPRRRPPSTPPTDNRPTPPPMTSPQPLITARRAVVAPRVLRSLVADSGSGRRSGSCNVQCPAGT